MYRPVFFVLTGVFTKYKLHKKYEIQNIYCGKVRRDIDKNYDFCYNKLAVTKIIVRYRQ